MLLLRVSRLAFWLAALAAAVALAVPTGWETGLTGLAVAASAAAFGLWRAGLAELRRSADAAVCDAAPLTRSALDEAAASVETCCAGAPGFEAALHGVARILKAELGALNVVVYRVMGVDATHARLSELVEAQPGFHLAEQRVHLQRSAPGRAIAAQREVVDPAGTAMLPVLGQGSVVALIELSSLQIGIDPEALAALLALAQAQLSQRAQPVAAKARRQHPDGGYGTRLGENA